MDALQQVPLTLCTSKATLATGTSVTTYSTTGSTLYCIKGKAYTTSAASTAATPTTDGTTGAAFVALAASQGCIYVWCYDGSSTTAATAIKVCQGAIVALDASGAFISAPQFPTIPDTLCPFGYSVMKLGSTGSAWTFGTSNWNATGMTVTHQDVMTLPGRPQIA
jgi:hypothetical protein